ncbi:MAG TPA: sugar phosphate isomerase/epimerase [Anaerolineales bacterium]|jgi:sugar phosphate isomerase/epimerase|nr:sugar phosphate isomerase/epimerase [Anaerolineales bacterium]HLF36443.1 sugar phosphate isomerase/epimerase [Anaerolineales bacterium]
MTGNWKLAIQEDMLPGPTLEDRFAQAAELGLSGIEFWSATLPEQANEIERLSGRGGVVAASINNGRRSRFLDPDLGERARALTELSEAIRLAGQIGASGVAFVPHFFGPLIPDLSPYMTPLQLERSLLSAQLQELTEVAERAGVQLWVEPVNHYETHLLVRLADAASIVAPLSSPRLGIVADLFHMALEEEAIDRAIVQNGPTIGHVHLADSNRRLPGQGSTDFHAALAALREIGYDAWLAFECGEPGRNHDRATVYFAELPAAIRSVLGGS